MVVKYSPMKRPLVWVHVCLPGARRPLSNSGEYSAGPSGHRIQLGIRERAIFERAVPEVRSMVGLAHDLPAQGCC
jgi:hypothetical protein